jgi:RNA polymerase sigma-70 factor (ECF subfamily)
LPSGFRQQDSQTDTGNDEPGRKQQQAALPCTDVASCTCLWQNCIDEVSSELALIPVGIGMRLLFRLVARTVMSDPARAIRNARGGDRQALGRLLEVYRNYLRLLARQQIGRKLQGKVDPSDLVQETFLAAQRDFAMFRGNSEAELVQWLRQIFAARLADLLRRYLTSKARDVRLEKELDAQLSESSDEWNLKFLGPEHSPSHSAARREQAVLLADALSGLPAHYAEVIILRHLDGCSFAEVAHRMGRSVKSVEGVWVRALARLREALGAI